MRKVLLASLLSSLVVSGCTKQKDSTSALESDNAPGKTLKLVLKDNVKTGDPAQCYDIVSADPVNQIFEAPYQYAYYRSSRPVVPLLAETMPTYSKDLKTMTFRLRKGVLFQDDPCFPNGKGRELKAADLIFSWKRHALTATQSEGSWIFENKVVGYDDFRKQYADSKDLDAVYAAKVEGMQALDDYTVQLQFLKPYPQMIYLLTMNFMAAIPVEAIKKYGPEIINHPVGTGPFKSVSWDPHSKVILVKNENFHGEAFPTAIEIDERYKSARAYAGKPMPFADRIVFRVLHEKQPHWLELLAGNLHQIEIPKDNVSEAVDPQDTRKVSPELDKKGFEITIDDSGTSHWYIYNNMLDPLISGNKLLRQAISSSLDRRAWLKIFRNNRGSVATEMTPTGIQDRCGNFHTSKYDYDLARAKKLLAQAGYPEGKGLPVLKFDLRGANTENRQIGEFVEKSLAAIGIKATVIPNTFPAFLDKRNKKNLQVAYGGWVLDYPDPENLMQLFYGPNAAPGPNESNFNNAPFDEMYQKLVTLMPGPEKKKLICQMESILQEEVPVIYGFYEDVYHLNSKKIKNFHAAEMIYNKYKYVDVVDQSAAANDSASQSKSTASPQHE